MLHIQLSPIVPAKLDHRHDETPNQLLRVARVADTVGGNNRELLFYNRAPAFDAEHAGGIREPDVGWRSGAFGNLRAGLER